VFDQYLKAVQRELSTGVAREHAYRPALKTLLESLESMPTRSFTRLIIASGTPSS